ncbi:hypothetical protein BGZ74_006018, partial [Mortierella antarctica]
MDNSHFQVQFQEPLGPGSNFQPASGSSVQHLVYKFENGQDQPHPASMLSNAASSAPAKLPEDRNMGSEHDMEVEFQDPTMAKLLDLAVYLQKQQQEAPISNQQAPASGSDSESDVSSNEPLGTKVKHGPHGPYRDYNDKQWEDT